MEKFYIVKSESKLYESYHNWIEDRKKIGAFMGKYLRENNLPEDTKYNIETGSLMIEYTEEVKQHFEKSLCKPLTNGAAYLRGNSKAAKDFAKVVEAENIKPRRKPSPSWFATDMSGGRFRHRLFEYGGALYMSFEAESFEFDNSQYQELTGSEFYKIMESF